MAFEVVSALADWQRVDCGSWCVGKWFRLLALSFALAERLMGGKAEGSPGSSNLSRRSRVWQPGSGLGGCSGDVNSLDYLQEEEL